MSDDDTVPAAPATIGDCTLVKLLGRGGMGEVYLARQRRFDRDVAVKVMRSRDAAFRERFLREARIAASLVHPNIVQVLDAGDEKDAAYLVMEYVAGESLADRLKREGALPEPLAARFIAQVARALHQAHQQGIVHRDVKPANVLLHRDGIAKLCDLGLARPVDPQPGDELTKTGVVMGTLAYMSPEQMADPRTAGPRADIYALGATFYHMLAGRTPFETSSIAVMARQHAEAPRPDPRAAAPGVSAQAAALFRRMMAIDPAQRPATMAEVATAMDELANGPAPVPARGPVKAVAAVLAVLVAVAGGAVFMRREPAAPASPSPAARTWTYEFDSPAELADWLPMKDSAGATAKVEVKEGALFVSGAAPAVARFRHHVRAERIRMRAACVEGGHINLYANTDWQGNWEGHGGVACIHREDGLLFCVDGAVAVEAKPPKLEPGRTYDVEVAIDAAGQLAWRIDGAPVHAAAVPHSGRTGAVLVGGYEATVRIERIEIAGR